MGARCFASIPTWASAFGTATQLVPAPRSLSGPTRTASKAGAAALRHKILDAMEERLAATLEQHALRQQEASSELRRVGCMVDHLAFWLFVLLPLLRNRELESRQQQGRESHGRWRSGVRRLVEDGGLTEDAR